MLHYTDISTRAAVVTLKATSGKTSAEISFMTGLSVRQVTRIYARAIDRGFDPNARPIQMKDAFIADAPRSGRPKKRTEEVIVLVSAKCRRVPYLFNYSLAGSQGSRLPQDEADEEAWIDEEDEAGSASMVP